MNPPEVLSEASMARSSREGHGWFEGVVSGLIRRAAHKAPPSLSERLEEEWLADVEARRGSLAQLRFALGCCWATRVIALELAAPVRAAAATAGRTATLLGPVPPILSRRTTVALLIGVLHVLVIVGLASGIASGVLPAPATSMHVNFVDKTVRPTAPPPPSNPTLVQVRPHLPRPLWTDATPGEGAITVPTGPPPVATAAPQRQVVRVTGGPGRAFPNTDDFYPAQSLRLGERGVATVRVCVDGAGRLTSDPLIAQSSGSARLDAGALRLAKAGTGHYLPSTEDGRSVSSCFPYSIRFALKN